MLKYTFLFVVSLVFLAACQNSPAPINPISESEPLLSDNLREAEVTLPGFDEPQTVTYEIVGEDAMFEGDIILGKVDSQGNLIKDELKSQGIVTDTGCFTLKFWNCHYRWKNGVIPYVINSNVTDSVRRRIMRAIAHWEAKTPIDFVERTSQGDYVEFVLDSKVCSSWIGRKGGKQEIKLSRNCSKGKIIHEIGHAVGLWHEHSREDRDEHVTIFWDNIKSGKKDQFGKFVSRFTDVGAYDFNSIMHYNRCFFARELSLCRQGDLTKSTILPKDRNIDPNRLGQLEGLSQSDINTVLHIYNIVKHPRFLEDVNGDGRKDIVGFGNDGVYVSLSTGSSFSTPRRWNSDYGHNNQGWRVDKHPRFLADVNGDGKKDVVGFANNGVYVSLARAGFFTTPKLWVKEYGYTAGGWRVDKHPRFLADVNGDGKEDVVGFANNGVYVSLSTGSSFTTASLWVRGYGYTSGNWRVEMHPRFLADVNGDGKQDVVGFDDSGVYVSLSTGSSFRTASRWVRGYGYTSGNWRVGMHPRFLADVNGDGKQDVVGFDDSGVYVSLSTGSSFRTASRWVRGYGYTSGNWRVGMHPRFLADVNGDGKQDVVGFDDSGVYVSLSTGSSFRTASLWVRGYGYTAGNWRVEKHPRFLADVNGDGKQDVVGFDDSRVYVSLSTSSSFTTASGWIDDYGYSNGWR